MDINGDLMLIRGSEPNLYVVPCEPSKKFQPLGYIVHENEIDSVAFLRSQSGNIHCLILDKQKKYDTYTMATCFILTDQILNDATSYLLPNTYQLRDESIFQMSFKILLKISGAYLSAIDLKRSDSDSNASFSENKEFDQAPQFILYTLTTDSHANCNLVTINLTREITGQTRMLIGHFPITECANLPIKVAVTMDFGSIAAIKSDGSIFAMNLADKISPIDESEISSIKKEFEAKELLLRKAKAILDANGPNETSIIDEDVKVIKVIKTSNAMTWLEQQFQNQRATDEEVFADTKYRVLKEFKQIKKELESMAEKNDLLTDLEKISLKEFELDSEERNAITEETNKILQKKREEIERNNLIKDFTHSALKSRCWETQEVKGRSILAYDSPIEVSNYPIHSMTVEEIRILNQAKLRRKIEMNIGALYRRECEKASNTEREKDGSEDISKEEVVSENTDPHLGSLAAKFGISAKLLYNQMELYTNDQKITQAILIQDRVRKLKLKFNKEFDECLDRKRQYIEEIVKRVTNINQIIPKIDPTAPLLSSDQYHLQQTESPENLLTCVDEEVDIEKYRSPKEIAAMEEAKREEEERLRREKLDNWRERGLDDMMGGVLEVTKEDELKKNIPVPYFVEAGKKESEMTPEEKNIYVNYLRACKELEEEREKYRKNETAIEETKSLIDEEIANLFKSYIKYEVALRMEELQVWKLKASVLQARELNDEEEFYNQTKIDLAQRIEKFRNIIQHAQNLIEGLQEKLELINVENNMLERNFRRDFQDVHGSVYDILLKAFRKRPNSGVSIVINPNSKATVRVRLRYLDIQLGFEDNVIGESIGSPESANPYKEAIIQSISLEAEWTAMQKALNEFDEANKMSEYNISPAIWNRLYKARMKKASKEMELKMTDHKLEIAKDFLRRREKEMEDATAELNEVEKAQSELKLKIYRAMTNVDVSIIMPQGQVEVDIESGSLVENFKNCLFINRKQIEDLNFQVIHLSNEKIDHMELIKSYRRRFKMLEWDLREMLMRYEDLLEKKRQITNFTITREIQRYLRNPNYDSRVAEEVKDSERTYAQLKANHSKNMAKMEKKIRYYNEKQTKEIKKENENLIRDLEKMNVDVNRVRSIYEQTPHATSDVLRAETCYKSLLRKVNLEILAQHQKSELKALHEELEQMRRNISSSIQD
ncbi:unnamed protein product [Hymenolepis diminuta]|uniref:Cilia- and flagella-associated protein 43 n=4 Tax=Hymenolepis diminuta TaxID=6216 RepID=A0A0R3SH48_HYMDI|nr:unnamed protein product [Hymenolepis diminuta]